MSVSSAICVLVYLCMAPFTMHAHMIPAYLQEIREHKDEVNSIMEYLLHGPGQHQTYEKVANITDMFGPRLSGSQSLEDAADYLMQMMEAEGLENVHSEPVKVPNWVRGQEVVRVLQPRELELFALGLGGTVGTDGSDIVADVIVVHSFEELKQRQNEVAGKIVVYNQDFKTYSTSRLYRNLGASFASQFGAVAALIRSVTDLSVYSPHTGAQVYWSNVTKIPSLCIAVEDAEALSRWHRQGINIRISISSTSQSFDMTWSKNVMAEIVGTAYPDQVVVFGGHIDSWDVGTGAMDDMAEVIMSWQVLSTLKALGLKPKRTMRMLAWTAEEIGLQGAIGYHKAHRDEANKTSLLMESDFGLFTPVNFNFRGSQEAIDIIQAISDLLGQNRLPVLRGGAGADLVPWKKDGVPTLSLQTDHTKYFYYHHSKGDTVSVYTPDELDKCTLLWTTLAYVVADLDMLLPRVTSEEYHHMHDGMINSAMKGAQSDDVIVLCGLLSISLFYRKPML